MPARKPAPPQLITISTSTFLKIIGITAVILLLWVLREIVAIVFLAILLAALIDPFADWFAKRHIPRGLSVIIVYAVLAMIVTLVSLLLVPAFATQGKALIDSFPGVYSQAVETVGELQVLSAQYGLEQYVEEATTSFKEWLDNQAGSLFSTAQGVVKGVAGTFIVLVLTFYLVVEEDSAKRFFKHLAPARYRPFLSQLAHKLQLKIGAWLRGQLLLGLIVGTLVYIGLSILGVEYALLLAIIAGLFEIIPYVGPVASLIPAVIIGFGQSLITGLFVLVIYFLVQQIENNVLVPKIMQKVTGLNPIVSILALLIGIKLGGLIGAIIAIPVATMGAVLIQELVGDHA